MALPWCDDANERDAALMRWVCRHECPVVAACAAEVDAELAAHRRVVGMRAGESPRQRVRRLTSTGMERADVRVTISSG